MALIPLARKKIGTCENCDKPDMPLYHMHGNMWLCEDCKALEDAAAARAQTATEFIAESKKVDSTIQVKSDIFNAETVSIIALRGAIWSDDSITDKQLALFNATREKLAQLKKAAFDAAVIKAGLDNQVLAWQVATQEIAGQLSSEYREKFKEFDVNYTPDVTKAKVIKAAKSNGGSKKASAYKASELHDVCTKHNLDPKAVRMMMLKKGVNAEDAAQLVLALYQ